MDNHPPPFWNISSTSPQPQMDSVKVTIKAYLEDGEIRRFVIEDLRSYKTLHDRIRAAFPALAHLEFILSWMDSEGDEIVMSSDAELAQALQNMKDGLLRIYVNFDALRKRAVAAPTTANPTAAGLGTVHGAPVQAVHAGVLCDACDQEIRGVRYKCLQCEDYDLCGPCHGRKMHEEHDMLKLVNPGTVSLPFTAAVLVMGVEIASAIVSCYISIIMFGFYRVKPPYSKVSNIGNLLRYIEILSREFEL